MTVTDKTSDERVCAMLFGIRRSVRYYHRRTSFFGGIHRVAMLVSLFMAMATGVLAIQGHGSLALIFSVAVALVVAADAIANSASNCALHMLLAYRFQELEKTFNSDGTLPVGAYDRINNERLSIEQENPAPLRLLDVLFNYELLGPWDITRTGCHLFDSSEGYWRIGSGRPAMHRACNRKCLRK